MFERHGMTDTKEYRSWMAMRRRCNDPKDKKFDRYGGRGITVCSLWNESFEAFLRDMGSRPPNTTIERIDNNKGYEPSNCRWATLEEQNNNRCSVELIEYNGKKLSLKQWSRELGVKYQTLISRKRKGCDLAEILAEHSLHRSITLNGITKSISEWSATLGIKKNTIISRFKRGLPPEEILRVGAISYPKNRKSRKK